jgi:hypothetical protein
MRGICTSGLPPRSPVRRSVPCRDGLFGKPNRQLSPPHQRSIIVWPIGHSVSRLGEFVTATLIELVWHGFPKSGYGMARLLYRPGDSAAIRPAVFRSPQHASC